MSAFNPGFAKRATATGTGTPIAVTPIVLVTPVTTAQPVTAQPVTTAQPLLTAKQTTLHVVLDLDECLVHSEFLRDPLVPTRSLDPTRFATQVQAKQEHHHDTQPVIESFVVKVPSGHRCQVFLRPNLKEFLLGARARGYVMHLFTASMETEYAVPVVRQLEAFVLGADADTPLFEGRFYRQHCTKSKDGKYVKDLANLPIPLPLDRTVLVDNNHVCFRANPSNGILVNDFHQDSRDNTLSAVLAILRDLETAQDVRSILIKRFNLKAAIDSGDPFQIHQATVMCVANGRRSCPIVVEETNKAIQNDQLGAGAAAGSVADPWFTATNTGPCRSTVSRSPVELSKATQVPERANNNITAVPTATTRPNFEYAKTRPVGMRAEVAEREYDPYLRAVARAAASFAAVPPPTIQDNPDNVKTQGDDELIAERKPPTTAGTPAITSIKHPLQGRRPPRFSRVLKAKKQDTQLQLQPFVLSATATAPQPRPTATTVSVSQPHPAAARRRAARHVRFAEEMVEVREYQFYKGEVEEKLAAIHAVNHALKYCDVLSQLSETTSMVPPTPTPVPTVTTQPVAPVIVHDPTTSMVPPTPTSVPTVTAQPVAPVIVHDPSTFSFTGGCVNRALQKLSLQQRSLQGRREASKQQRSKKFQQKISERRSRPIGSFSGAVGPVAPPTFSFTGGCVNRVLQKATLQQRSLQGRREASKQQRAKKFQQKISDRRSRPIGSFSGAGAAPPIVAPTATPPIVAPTAAASVPATSAPIVPTVALPTFSFTGGCVNRALQKATLQQRSLQGRREASEKKRAKRFQQKISDRRSRPIGSFSGATAPSIVAPTAAASVPATSAPIVAPTAAAAPIVVAATMEEVPPVNAAASDSSNVPLQPRLSIVTATPTAMPPAEDVESPNTRWWREWLDNPTMIYDPSVLDAAAAALPSTEWLDGEVTDDDDEDPFPSADESIVALPPQLAGTEDNVDGLVLDGSTDDDDAPAHYELLADPVANQAPFEPPVLRRSARIAQLVAVQNTFQPRRSARIAARPPVSYVGMA